MNHRGTEAQRWSAVLILALVLVAGAALGATNAVKFELGDFTSQGTTNRKVLVKPLFAPVNVGGTVISVDPVMYNSGNGFFWVSNMVAGSYQVELLAPPAVTRFTVGIPDTNGVLSAGDWLISPTNTAWPPGGYAWSTTASDARYLPAGANAPWVAANDGYGTNLSLMANTYLKAGALNVQVQPFQDAFAGWMGVRVVGDLMVSNVISVGGEFIGDGSGLTNLQASGTSGALTNNETRAVTFAGRTTFGTNLTINLGPTSPSYEWDSGLKFTTTGVTPQNFMFKYGAGPGLALTNEVWSQTFTWNDGIVLDSTVGPEVWRLDSDGDITFKGVATGNGGGLTNLPGAGIQAGTISSNKLDATAYAAFIGGGSGGLSATDASQFATNSSSQLAIKDNVSLTNVSLSGVSNNVQLLFNVKNYGAKGDYSVDDSAAIQAAFDAATNRGGTIYIPHGRYKISNTVNLPWTVGSGTWSDTPTNGIRIFGDGIGSQLDGTECTNAMLAFNSTPVGGDYKCFTGLILERFKITKPRNQGVTNHAPSIFIHNDAAVVDNVPSCFFRLSDMTFDGGNMMLCFSNVTIVNPTIERCRFLNYLDCGIYAAHCDSLAVRDSFFASDKENTNLWPYAIKIMVPPGLSSRPDSGVGQMVQNCEVNGKMLYGDGLNSFIMEGCDVEEGIAGTGLHGRPWFLLTNICNATFRNMQLSGGGNTNDFYFLGYNYAYRNVFVDVPHFSWDSAASPRLFKLIDTTIDSFDAVKPMWKGRMSRTFLANPLGSGIVNCEYIKNVTNTYYRFVPPGDNGDLGIKYGHGNVAGAFQSGNYNYGSIAIGANAGSNPDPMTDMLSVNAAKFAGISAPRYGSYESSQVGLLTYRDLTGSERVLRIGGYYSANQFDCNKIEFVASTGMSAGAAPSWTLASDKTLTAASGGTLVLTAPTAPTVAGSTGAAGQFAWDANYFYIATATDIWRRIPLTTFLTEGRRMVMPLAYAPVQSGVTGGSFYDAYNTGDRVVFNSSGNYIGAQIPYNPKTVTTRSWLTFQNPSAYDLFVTNRLYCWSDATYTKAHALGADIKQTFVIPASGRTNICYTNSFNSSYTNWSMVNELTTTSNAVWLIRWEVEDVY